MLGFFGRVAMGTFLLSLAAGCGSQIDEAATGGGGGDDTTAGAGGSTSLTAPTFAEVHEQVLLPHGCAGAYCHLGSFGGEDLHAAYTHLVGAKAAESGECEGHTLVAPGDPEHSLVYLKLASTNPPCGKSMPPTGFDAVPAADVELLRAWIAAGAPE